MKKLALLSLCAALAACGSSSSNGMKDYCLDAAKQEGKKITPEMRMHCECMDKKATETFGADKVAEIIKAFKGEESTVTLESIQGDFIGVSYGCALESKIAETMDLEDGAEFFVPMLKKFN
ncbi:MAG: hypothetical protein K5912_01730 [Alphaproteobacteria bacterium]|nr:hypothetical protein [Alphaproteobacteria bacterium]